MPNRYANLLFDLDGTLVDSAPDIIFCVKKAFVEVYGGGAPEVSEGLIGLQLKDILFGIDPALSPGDVRRLTETFRRAYDECGWPGTRLYGGAEKALLDIKASGSRLFLVTNKPAKPTRGILLKVGLNVFEEVICPDSTEGARLSKEEMVKRVIAGRALDPRRTALVGDSEPDMLAARDNGIAAIAVLYGYGSAEKLRALGPDHTLPDISGLAELINV